MENLSVKVAVRVRPFNKREIENDAKLIVQMDGKLTRLHKNQRQTMWNESVTSPNANANNDFTYDYSYWSFSMNDKHFATQEQVYNDLGLDVINSAFQGF